MPSDVPSRESDGQDGKELSKASQVATKATEKSAPRSNGGEGMSARNGAGNRWSPDRVPATYLA